MSIEIEKAMRAAPQRKVNAGIPPRDPVSGGLHFQQRQAAPRWLIVAAVLAVLLIVGLALSYLYAVPPSHLLIIGLGLFWIFGWGIRKHRRSN
jgi:hypothetical protein